MSPGRWLARLAAPLAAGIALAVLSAFQGDPTAAAESAYLALLAAAALLPAAALAPGSMVPAWGAVLAVLTGWAVPTGPARGAALVVVLVVTLALAAGRALNRHRGAGADSLDWTTAVALGLGLQILCRSRLLLAVSLDPETLVRLFALPVAGAAALVYLAARGGRRNVLVAAGAALAMTAGWTVPSALGLLTLAAADLAGRSDLPAAARWPVLLLPAAAAWTRDPGLAVALLLLGLAAVPDRRALLALASLAALIVAIFLGRIGWAEAWIGLAWLPLLLPTALLPGGVAVGRLAVAGAVALAGLRLVPPDVALAGPLAWVALALPERPSRSRLQELWGAALLAGTALLAAYPWFRPAPLVGVLERLALAPGWVSAIAVTLVAGGLAWLSERGRRSGFTLRPAAAGLLLAALAALAALPRTSATLLDREVAVLTAESPRWSAEPAAAAPAAAVVLDSYLAESAVLPAGTPFAILVLETSAGESRFELRAGADSAEWAARRRDVAERPDFAAPDPWLSWPTGERFFAQRYRTRKELPVAATVRQVRLERRAELPPRTQLVVFHLELRR